MRGDQFLFPPNAIRHGEILTCLSGGIRVKGRVPPSGRGAITHSDGTNGAATMAVKTRADGTVIASCR